MSSQIQDLIANFDDKFDTQFGFVKPQCQVLDISNQKEKQQVKIDNNQAQKNNEFQKSDTQTKQQVRVIKQYNVDKEIAIDQNQNQEQQKQKYQEQNQQQLNDGQFQENKYKQLSNKLQTALKKISSSKKVFQSSHIRSSQLLARFSQYQKKKEKELTHKRNQEEEKKYYQVKNKPLINKKSKQLASEMNKKPIYERYQQLVQQKKKKQEQNEQRRKKKEQQQFQEFLEEYNSHLKIPQNKRNTQKFYDDMKIWKNNINKKRQVKQTEKQKKQQQQLTFKPAINKTSQELLKNKKRIPIHQRQIQRLIIEDPQLTFQPNVKKRKLK